MARHFVLCSALLFPLLAVASDAIPKSAPNCDLQVPPDGAGEDAVHALLVKIFPRKSVVGGAYTGCQIAWIQSGNTWEKFSVMYFRKGQLQAWVKKEDETNSLGQVCRYPNGQLAANQSKKCYVPMAGLQGSFGPGCMAEMIKSGEMGKACEMSMEQ